MFEPHKSNYALSLVPQTNGGGGDYCTSTINKPTSTFEKYASHSSGVFDDYFVRSMFDACGIIVLEVCEHMVCVLSDLSSIELLNRSFGNESSSFKRWYISKVLSVDIVDHLFNDHAQEMNRWFNAKKNTLTNNGSIIMDMTRIKAVVRDDMALYFDAYQIMSINLQCASYNSNHTQLYKANSKDANDAKKKSLYQDCKIIKNISLTGTLKYDNTESDASMIHITGGILSSIHKKEASNTIQQWNTSGIARRISFRFLTLQDLQQYKLVVSNTNSYRAELSYRKNDALMTNRSSYSSSTTRQCFTGLELIREILSQNIALLNTLRSLSKSMYHKITNHPLFNFYYAILDQINHNTLINGVDDRCVINMPIVRAYAYSALFTPRKSESLITDIMAQLATDKSFKKYIIKYAPWYHIDQNVRFKEICKWIVEILDNRNDIIEKERIAQGELFNNTKAPIGSGDDNDNDDKNKSINERLAIAIFGLSSTISIDSVLFTIRQSRTFAIDVLKSRLRTLQTKPKVLQKIDIDSYNSDDRSLWCFIPNADNNNASSHTINTTDDRSTTTTPPQPLLHPSIEFDTFLFSSNFAIEPEYTKTLRNRLYSKHGRLIRMADRSHQKLNPTNTIVETQSLLRELPPVVSKPKRKKSTTRRTITTAVTSDDDMIVEDDDNNVSSDSQPDDDDDELLDSD